MDDLISRQAAIDAVKKNTFRLTFAEEQIYKQAGNGVTVNVIKAIAKRMEL